MEDPQRHINAIQEIADATARPVEEVARRYEETLAHMQARASVPDYLPLLVAKRVRQFYRE